METILKYRGRSVNKKDVATILKIIAANPDASRRFISQEVCRAWGWTQANGALKDMVCRSLLLLLESKGLIKQPPPKRILPNPLANRKKPARANVDQSPIFCTLKELLPIQLVQVRKTKQDKLFNGLVDEHHYLGYTQPVGEHLKYIAFSNERILGCLSWGSSPWYISSRDRFIGWSNETRQKNLNLIINNVRFLIPPWVHVSHLASYLLSISRRILQKDWIKFYNHPIHLLETFIDTEKFRATCYKADNWIYVGHTTGRGKLSKSNKPTRSKKAVYVYPLTRNFKKALNS